ncbi:MAG: hypothetical protein EZS28_049803, partial [Streblomastix strix]
MFLVYNSDVGLITAKVIRNDFFDSNNWDDAGRLQAGEPIPFIAQFKAAKSVDKFVIILMDINHIIQRNYNLQPGTLRAIAKQIFQGLRMIHSRGLVHHDIKSENILFHSPPGSGRVITKIADFGLVKISNILNQTMLMTTKG